MAANSKKVIVAALVGNGLIAVTKFIASAITGSSAMFSEGIHSVVDTGNQVLLLWGLRRAKRPADERFPFGHGKEIYFWSFVVAILIFAVGSGLSLYEGIEHIRHPAEVTSPMINYIVLGLAMIFEGGALYFALTEFNKARGERSYLQAVSRGKDPTLFVVLFEDSAAMLGLIVAFIGIWLGQVTGNPIYDGIASVMIGVILGGTAVWLAYETKGLLIGESANPAVVKGIKKLVASRRAVEHVNEVLTLHMGPEYILVNLSVAFPDDLPTGRVEEVVAEIDRAIKRKFPNVKRVFIEAEERHRPGQRSD